MSIEPFNKLVKLAARAFYDDITAKGDNQPKSGRSDNRGIAVVVLDALTRRQWVREEDLAKDLKLHLKQLRRTLRFFEEEKLVTRDHRKETAKGARAYSAAVAATADNLPGRDGEEKIKLHTHSYCCLDYAQIHDVVRYRLQRMKKKLKDELDNKNTVQEYDEYVKAYYAAILQRQKEQEEAAKREQDLLTNNIPTDVDPSSSRKRQRDDDGEDVEWEETPTAEVSGDEEGDDDDGIDWEEG
ncbi:hypothetical protein M8C21_016671 [Ambrosia artemisiifolia]|uniref:HTH TFE/IIEalpha-type domain-containing protein n=1 Tax=Ambrosia artemisiifolia TaxID=4212 RepID=A0AAD5BW85_AMBAR|nr:hypothetical protein M8C21_016671 [Ambrosia artemisiifolia]